MAEPWQQWMPHDIDAWQGSANVQALSDLAYRAVHNLLQDMWKQPDCSLPTDDRELAKRSRVMQRWEQCRDEVLEYFADRTDTGRITHRVLLKKWNKAHEVYESRQNAAKRTNAVRSANANRDGDRNAEPTHEHKQEQEHIQKEEVPIASTAIALSARGKIIGTLPVVGKNAGEVEIFEADVGEWREAFPGIDVRGELVKFKQWCRDNPTRQKTRKGIRRAVNQWLTRAQDNQKGGTNAGFKGSAERNWDAVRASLQDCDAFGGTSQPEESRTIEGGLPDFRLGPLGLPPVRH